MRKTRAAKIAEARIDRAYRSRCSGIAIPLMDIPKVFRAGEAAIAASPAITDEELGDAVAAFVDTIKVAV